MLGQCRNSARTKLLVTGLCESLRRGSNRAETYVVACENAGVVRAGNSAALLAAKRHATANVAQVHKARRDVAAVHSSVWNAALHIFADGATAAATNGSCSKSGRSRRAVLILEVVWVDREDLLTKRFNTTLQGHRSFSRHDFTGPLRGHDFIPLWRPVNLSERRAIGQSGRSCQELDDRELHREVRSLCNLMLGVLDVFGRDGDVMVQDNVRTCMAFYTLRDITSDTLLAKLTYAGRKPASDQA